MSCFYVLSPPKRSQTVVATGATGAVGSIAVQLLRTTGARVVGIAGGPKKNKFLTEDLGLDAAVDHPERSLDEQLADACPQGIIFVFDNVGGDTLDKLLGRINPGGKVVSCGAISQYSGNLSNGKVHRPGNYIKLEEREATMKGFNVMQHMYKRPLAILGMLYYYLRGQSFPQASEDIFNGGHIGKLLVKVDPK